MESPAPTPGSQILRRSSMFHFFRSLVGSKGSPKSSDKALLGDQQCPLRELAAASLMTDGQGEVGKKDPRLQASVPHTLSVALPQHDPSGLGMGVGVLSITAPGVEVKSVLPRESLEVLGNLSEKEEREEEEEEAAEEASGDTGTSDRGHFPQALEVKQRATGPLEVSPEVFTREEKEECLLDGDLGLASLNMGATPWSHLLTLYKQLQKLAMAKEGLPHKEEGEEEEMEEEDSSFQLCVPGIVTLQSPLHKTFRSTDTVGCMESELEKLLVVQQESHLWKMGGHEGQEPLVHPEISPEEAGIVDDQGHQADGEGSHHPAFGECWGPGREALRQLKHHPRLERGVRSPPSVVYSTEHLLLEEMDEMGNWPPE
ncbi:gametogenetin-binding protein 1-like isoform X2 [Phyllostomus hastatus]|uniref:gametogenetin-binding protein 1-like isoform X2 n=1 Tax=Phyllostomus hastatus TaxID=9423 RepID=UPI001E683E1D|nr:gametogenetin-binding protein 1-like isoform X2 [Phyllostomus hastatus]